MQRIANFGPRINRRREPGEHYHDGYNYHTSRVDRGVTYLVCTMKNAHGCPVVAKKTNGNIRIPAKYRHNHPADFEIPQNTEFFNALYRSTVYSFAPLQFIYEHEIAMYPEMAANFPFEHVSPRMRTWRAHMILPEVQSLQNFHEILHSRPWHSLRTHDRGSISSTLVQREDGQQGLIFSNGVVNQLATIGKLIITCSSSIKPNVGNTVATLLFTVVHEKKAFNFAWGLINNYSSELLEDIMVHIKDEVLLETPIENIETNYDWRFQASITNVWPNVNISSPFVIFVQTILHHANLDVNIDLNNREHWSIVQKIILLSWLQPGQIPAAFTWIKQSMNENLSLSFDGFLTWFQLNYIGDGQNVEWSYYNKFDLFNNAHMVTTRHLMNQLATPENCAPILFLKTILKISSTCTADLQRILQRQQQVPRPLTFATCINQKQLRRLWALLDAGDVNAARFLSIAINIATGFFNLVHFQREYVNGAFEPRRVGDQLAGAIAEVDPPVAIVEEPIELLNNINFYEFGRLRRLQQQQEQQRQQQEQQEQQQEQQQQQVLVAENQEAGNDERAINIEWRCMQCNIRPVLMVSRPCNCVVLCRECVVEIRRVAINLNCPRCNNLVRHFERVFLPLSNNAELPYDMVCQVCNENPVNQMSQTCHQLMTCLICVEASRTANPGIEARCLMCNIPGEIVTVQFRPRLGI